MYGNILQLLGELGVENGQQPVVHSLHVCLWIGRSIGRHRRLLCQHLACRQKGIYNQIDFFFSSFKIRGTAIKNSIKYGCIWCNAEEKKGATENSWRSINVSLLLRDVTGISCTGICCAFYWAEIIESLYSCFLSTSDCWSKSLPLCLLYSIYTLYMPWALGASSFSTVTISHHNIEEKRGFKL